MEDRQMAECMYDIFGVEIYPGETYWTGDEGAIADPGQENYDPGNAVIAMLVEQLGTRYILEAVGYAKSTF